MMIVFNPRGIKTPKITYITLEEDFMKKNDYQSKIDLDFVPPEAAESP